MATENIKTLTQPKAGTEQIAANTIGAKLFYFFIIQVYCRVDDI